MAIWQFDVALMPDIIVSDAAKYIAESFTEDGVVTAHWWKYNQPSPTFFETIARYYPRTESWHKDLLQWGDQDAVLVKAWQEVDVVSELLVRIDIRHVGQEELLEFCDCVTNLTCHVYVFESQTVVPPILETLLQHVRESRAARFCRDPHGFLESLGSEIESDED